MLLTTLFYCFVTRRWSSKSVSSTLGQSRPAKVCMCKYIKEIMANDSANAHDAAQSICSSFSTPSRFPNTKRPSLHGTAPRPLEIFIHEHFNFKLIRSSLVVYLRDSTLLGRFTAIIMASTRTIRWNSLTWNVYIAWGKFEQLLKHIQRTRFWKMMSWNCGVGLWQTNPSHSST